MPNFLVNVLWPLAKPYAVDKGVWVAAAVALANALAPHLPWHTAAPLLNDIAVSFASWLFVHVSHTKVFKELANE